ncbi:glycosyltransferase 87 family protein [Robertkochia aurantiaca]|uniref:glycosyltransferase 87 family protein n=1 Tax=Robertkochia aurantiaca TaxID=2873700 RepID=UPI001CCEEE38|nr:glycosyltransferase 87 family protein [Robertkochia sp. 3YJGBD-33]
MAVLYFFLAYQTERTEFWKLIGIVASLFLLTFWLLRIANKRDRNLLLGTGILFRLIFIVAIPALSQDYFRFIWDGLLLMQGINPYLFTPEMLMEIPGFPSELTRELYQGMGSLSASHYSNYPPLNQLFFRLAAGMNDITGSLIIMRLMLLGGDLLVLVYGRKLLRALHLSPNYIWWYFLNPFIILECSGNLHFEGVMAAFLIMALYFLNNKKYLLSAVLLGMSVSVKLLPLMFLPLILWHLISAEGRTEIRSWLKATSYALTTLLISLGGFIPFLSEELIKNYGETLDLWFHKFEFNASIYYLIREVGYLRKGYNIIETVGDILPLLIIAAILLLTFVNKNSDIRDLIRNMMWAATIYLILSTTVHPWYLVTPLVLSLFTSYRYMVIWSALVFLSYYAYNQPSYRESALLLWFEYVPVVSLILWEIFRKPLAKASSN